MCSMCDLCVNRKHVVVGRGSMSSNIMIIGECPGPEEDEAGLPFMGATGKLMSDILDSIGVPEKDIYFTTAVKCFPYHSINSS